MPVLVSPIQTRGGASEITGYIDNWHYPYNMFENDQNVFALVNTKRTEHHTPLSDEHVNSGAQRGAAQPRSRRNGAVGRRSDGAPTRRPRQASLSLRRIV